MTNANDPLAWLTRLPELLADGGRAVLITTANTVGSTPRESGAAMVISADEMFGTLGGGHLEHEAVRIAREALAAPFTHATWVVRFPLAARLGQCCGGVATLAFAALDRTAIAWLSHAHACLRTGAPFALAARISPGAQAAQRMLITSDDTQGSLGHAGLDSAAIAAARVRLHAHTGGATLVSSSGDEMLLVHVVTPDPFDLLIFGNGHVGRALVQVLGVLPAHVQWIDSRESDFPPYVPANVAVVVTDTPEAEIARAPRGAFAVVMTHSHPLDFAIMETALTRDDWRYLGLIGSKSKRTQFERRLMARGIPLEKLARVVCPIGVRSEGLRSKEPGVIALGVATEMLAVREREHRQMQSSPVSAHR